MSKVKTIEELIKKYPNAYKNAQIELNEERNEKMRIAKLIADSANGPNFETKRSERNIMSSHMPVPKDIQEVEDFINDEAVSLLINAAKKIGR